MSRQLTPAAVWARQTFAAGTAGGLMALIALAIASGLQGDWPFAALNATAHWAFGPQAALTKEFVPSVTGLGLATHWLASLYWALVLVAIVHLLRAHTEVGLFALALTVAAVAAVFDYGLLPRTLSPGWHLVVGPTAIAAAFLALGVGMFVGLRVVDRP